MIGFNGSPNASTLKSMMIAVKAKDIAIFDFGAGEGRFLLAASASGAHKAFGVEFPQNLGYKYLFHAMCKIIKQRSLSLSVKWIGQDIDMLI